MSPSVGRDAASSVSDQRQQWAGSVDQIKFVWPDRGDAVDGRKEPKTTIGHVSEDQLRIPMPRV